MRDATEKKLALAAMNVDVNFSGVICVSVILYSQRVKRLYSGYTINQAKAEFSKFIHSI
jgi:hypothetical protein